MQIGRRDFLRYCALSGAALGLPVSVLSRLEKAYAQGAMPTVVWLNGANCTGCTVSLANRVSTQGPTDVADLLINYINLEFHPNLMAAAGDLSVDALKHATDPANGGYILAVDGGVPTAFGGHTCLLWTEADGREVTAMEAVHQLAPNAVATLCIGTCASFGGIAAGNPNPTGIMNVPDFLSGSNAGPIINIPGCPTHPDWIVWVVAQLLVGSVPALDGQGRPAALFSGESCNVHERCPREEREEASAFGVEGLCLEKLGCKGPRTQADCPTRLWNGGTEWCVGANAICIGCTEFGFPDAVSPLYSVQPEEDDDHGALPLTITRAEWLDASSELWAQGAGTPGRIVSVKNADTWVTLGATTVASSGAWTVTVRNPYEVPSTVQAESRSESVQSAVTSSPGPDPDPNPDPEPPPDPDPEPPPSPLEITRAAWNEKRSRLEVEGRANPGSGVTVKNAGTSSSLDSTTASRRGRWKVSVRRPNPMPSRVRAESDGFWAERTVSGVSRDDD